MAGRRATGPTVSVAVLSYRRPKLLWRVLDAVSRLDYDNFEIVVVGDQPDIAAYGLPEWLAAQVKYRAYRGANICKSRNIALELSAGEIVAFVDDDAVPEPDWLTRLVRAFRFPDVGGVGGLVRCNDGVNVEWAGGVFDREAVEKPLKVRDEIRVFDADSQVFGNQFIGTIGANSAFRREAVLSVGGFDESFRYYLDETDLMLRLAEAGWDAAFVRTAEVHHAREANDVRDRLRVPRNLHEIAASKAYFCRRHLAGNEVPAALERFRNEKLDELDPYIRLGLVRVWERKELQTQIKNGVADGLSRERALPLTERFAEHPFRKFMPQSAGLSVALCAGWGLSLNRTARLARALAAQGVDVTFIGFSSGRAAHTVDFREGVWWHRGGTWRGDQRFQGKRVFGRVARALAEIARVLPRRHFDLVLTQGALPNSLPVKLPGGGGEFQAASLAGARLDRDEAVSMLMLIAERLNPGSAPARLPSRPQLEPDTGASTIPG